MIAFKPLPALPVDYRVSLRNVVGITFLTALFAVLLGAILIQLDPALGPEGKDPVKKFLWLFLVLLLSVIVATGYVLAWRTPRRWAIIGFAAPTARWVLISVAVGAVLFFFAERADALLRLGIIETIRTQFASGLTTQVGLVSIFVLFGLVRPITLEIYFRGVLLNFFVGRFGQQAGLFITSLLFAGLFYQAGQYANMALGFVYALAFGLLFLRSGSLWNSIVAHATLGILFAAKAAWT